MMWRGQVPTNAELAERAKSLDAHTVVRNWISRHPAPESTKWDDVLKDRWLDWAASNFLADPEVGVHLVKLQEMEALADEWQNMSGPSDDSYTTGVVTGWRRAGAALVMALRMAGVDGGAR